jgi:hypothetical protein
MVDHEVRVVNGYHLVVEDLTKLLKPDNGHR